MLLLTAEVTQMDMKAQTKWGWDHSIYLFLGGLGAAAYVTGAIAGFASEDWAGISKAGIIFGVIALGVGYLVLLIGLGVPKNAIYSMKCPGTSWISRGVIIVTLFLVFAGIHWIVTVFNLSITLGRLLSVPAIILGFGVMMYTGYLLAANRPIALWSNPLTPMVFLLNALYSGILATILVSALFVQGAIDQINTLGLHAVAGGAIMIFVLVFYVSATHRVPEGRAAVEMMISGTAATMFWFGVVIVGLLIPLVLELFATQMENPVMLHILAAIAGLIGMLLLRHVILVCGVFARLKAARFEYVLPHI